VRRLGRFQVPEKKKAENPHEGHEGRLEAPDDEHKMSQNRREALEEHLEVPDWRRATLEQRKDEQAQQGFGSFEEFEGLESPEEL
jgi:hypothetical protein